MVDRSPCATPKGGWAIRAVRRLAQLRSPTTGFARRERKLADPWTVRLVYQELFALCARTALADAKAATVLGEHITADAVTTRSRTHLVVLAVDSALDHAVSVLRSIPVANKTPLHLAPFLQDLLADVKSLVFCGESARDILEALSRVLLSPSPRDMCVEGCHQKRLNDLLLLLSDACLMAEAFDSVARLPTSFPELTTYEARCNDMSAPPSTEEGSVIRRLHLRRGRALEGLGLLGAAGKVYREWGDSGRAAEVEALVRERKPYWAAGPWLQLPAAIKGVSIAKVCCCETDEAGEAKVVLLAKLHQHRKDHRGYVSETSEVAMFSCDAGGQGEESWCRCTLPLEAQNWTSFFVLPGFSRTEFAVVPVLKSAPSASSTTVPWAWKGDAGVPAMSIYVCDRQSLWWRKFPTRAMKAGNAPDVLSTQGTQVVQVGRDVLVFCPPAPPLSYMSGGAPTTQGTMFVLDLVSHVWGAPESFDLVHPGPNRLNGFPAEQAGGAHGNQSTVDAVEAVPKLQASFIGGGGPRGAFAILPSPDESSGKVRRGVTISRLQPGTATETAASGSTPTTLSSPFQAVAAAASAGIPTSGNDGGAIGRSRRDRSAAAASTGQDVVSAAASPNTFRAAKCRNRHWTAPMSFPSEVEGSDATGPVTSAKKVKSMIEVDRGTTLIVLGEPELQRGKSGASTGTSPISTDTSTEDWEAVGGANSTNSTNSSSRSDSGGEGDESPRRSRPSRERLRAILLANGEIYDGKYIHGSSLLPRGTISVDVGLEEKNDTAWLVSVTSDARAKLHVHCLVHASAAAVPQPAAGQSLVLPVKLRLPPTVPRSSSLGMTEKTERNPMTQKQAVVARSLSLCPAAEGVAGMWASVEKHRKSELLYSPSNMVKKHKVNLPAVATT